MVLGRETMRIQARLGAQDARFGVCPTRGSSSRALEFKVRSSGGQDMDSDPSFFYWLLDRTLNPVSLGFSPHLRGKNESSSVGMVWSGLTRHLVVRCLLTPRGVY